MRKRHKTLTTLLLTLTLLSAPALAKKQKPKPGPPHPGYMTILLEDRTILQVSNTAVNKIVYLYDNLPRELPLCLEGKRTGNRIRVEDVRMPVYLESVEDRAQYNRAYCHTDEYVGVVHNHPSPSDGCHVSVTDYERFVKDRDAVLEWVICDADRETGRFNYEVMVKTITIP